MTSGGERARASALAFFFFFLVPLRSFSAPSPLVLELKGHAQTLLTRLDGRSGSDSSTLDATRLRLDADARWRERWNLKVVADLESFTGSALRDPLARAGLEPQDRAYWDLDGTSQHGASLALRASLYRLCLTHETRAVRADVGKQRLAWGVMRFWRPTDLFNPESPLQLEPGERQGVDAVRVRVELPGGGDVEGAYAPSHQDRGDAAAIRLHQRSGLFDLTVLGGRLGRDDVAGFTFDGYWGRSGVRGELLRVAPEGADAYCMAAVGADRAFKGDLTLTLEALSNGGATDQPLVPLSAYEGLLRTRARSQVGVGATWKPSPLVTWSVFTAADVERGSFAVMPRMAWDLRQTLELTVGVAAFGGGSGGEYGASPTTWFAQLKKYF